MLWYVPIFPITHGHVYGIVGFFIWRFRRWLFASRHHWLTTSSVMSHIFLVQTLSVIFTLRVSGLLEYDPVWSGLSPHPSMSFFLETVYYMYFFLETVHYSAVANCLSELAIPLRVTNFKLVDQRPWLKCDWNGARPSLYVGIPHAVITRTLSRFSPTFCCAIHCRLFRPFPGWW
jgi:hypothetical protein